jgi:hydrogenase maturation protease
MGPKGSCSTSCDDNPAMPRVLVIGYGNALRGDDGLGPEAARRLEREIDDPEIEIRAAHQLTPEMADDLSRAELVLFIDAGSKGRPGEVAVTEVEAAPPEQAITHQFDPALLLAATQLLYGHLPRAFLLTIAGESFEYEERLSETVLAALPEALAQARAVIRSA